MKIFVVIPNWNGAEYLKKCLESLHEQSIKHITVVVDNGSTDNSVSLVSNNFKDTILLKNSKNLGFAGGVNTGIKFALENNATSIALLNNDAVADKNWLKNLFVTAKNNPTSGIISCKLLQSDKKHIDSTGDFYSVNGIPFPRGRNQIDKGQFDKDNTVFGASGGASLYRAKMLREIGLFDERFFAYYEDVDISFRAQLAGWKVVYEPEAVAYHHIGSTSSKMGDFTRYHSIKNFLILYTKDMPAILYWKYLPKFLYQFMRTTARSIVDRNSHVWLKSVAMFLLYLPSILSDRHKIQKNRKVSVEYIEDILHKARPPKTPTL